MDSSTALGCSAKGEAGTQLCAEGPEKRLVLLREQRRDGAVFKAMKGVLII